MASHIINRAAIHQNQLAHSAVKQLNSQSAIIHALLARRANVWNDLRLDDDNDDAPSGMFCTYTRIR